MANRYLNQFQYTYEKDSVTIFGQFLVGASGAVTSFAGAGIASVVKESAAGQYTINFQDYFQRFLDFSYFIVDDAVTQVAQVQVLEDPALLQSGIKATKEFKIQCLAVESDATPVLIASNPAEGALVKFKVVFRNTSVGPYDT